MKRWYDMRSVTTTFGSGDLVWLHNPQLKKGISPKLDQARQGPYVVMERLNDVVYRIQRDPGQSLRWCTKTCFGITVGDRTGTFAKPEWG